MAVEKFLGRDCELSGTGIRADGEALDPWDVTRRVLSRIPASLQTWGTPVWNRSAAFEGSRYSLDCLRHWGANGQCYYSDMSHLEVCTPEVLKPRAFAAQCLSLLLATEKARLAAESDTGDVVVFSTANVDVMDPAISFGTHLNVQIERSLWEDLFLEQVHPARLGFVASVMAAAIPFFGAGYLLPAADGRVIYSLSARAHHLTKVHTLATTESLRRGLLNTRREPHGRHDRLHLIGFDFGIIGAALLASFLQCALAAAEEGYCGEVLYDPVESMRAWSWGLDLNTGQLPVRGTLIDGRRLTLAEFMRTVAGKLLAMCEGGLISPDVAPEATEMLPRIIELTHYLEEGSLGHCARHLDWAAKLLCLLAREEPLDSPESRLLDHDFGNTDPRRGMFWKLWDGAQVDPLVTRREVELCLVHPPAESRAWGRGQLIRRFSGSILDVDWGYVDLRDSPRSVWGGSRRASIDMPDLGGFTSAAFGPLVRRARDVEHLTALLDHARRAPHRAVPLRFEQYSAHVSN